MRAPAASFTPPTAEQVQTHLERHSLRPLAFNWAWLLLVGMCLLAAVGWSAEQNWVALAAWLLVLGLLFVLTGRVRRLRALERELVQAHELALLRRWPEALRRAWRLLPAAARVPELHGRAVALIAHTLDQLQAPEAAIIGYDYLLERLPAEHPAASQLRVQRALAHLACERLTDADDALRRLRSAAAAAQRGDESGGDSGGDGPAPSDAARGALEAARATLHLANLVQCVRTGHCADAADLAPGLIAQLRPLGLDAGYGYALLALAYYELARRQRGPEAEGAPAVAPDATAPEVSDDAARWWARATLLLPPAALIARYPELAVLARDPHLAAATSASDPPGPTEPPEPPDASDVILGAILEPR
jgi:hypothetical protein